MPMKPPYPSSQAKLFAAMLAGGAMFAATQALATDLIVARSVDADNLDPQ